MHTRLIPVTTAQITTLKTICVAKAFLAPSISFSPILLDITVLMPAVQPNANCRKMNEIDPVSPTPAISEELKVLPQIALSAIE